MKISFNKKYLLFIPIFLLLIGYALSQDCEQCWDFYSTFFQSEINPNSCTSGQCISGIDDIGNISCANINETYNNISSVSNRTLFVDSQSTVDFDLLTYEGKIGFTNFTTCGNAEIIKMVGGDWSCSAESGGSSFYPRSATFIISANNSINKTQSDYVCDGNNDEVEINNAISKLTNGGRILLMEGNYSISPTGINIGKNNVILEGQGYGTVLTNQQSSVYHLIHISNRYWSIKNIFFNSSNGYNVGIYVAPAIENFGIISNNMFNGLATGIEVDESSLFISIINNVFLNSSYGVQLSQANDIIISGNKFNAIRYWSISYSGSYAVISNNNIISSGFYIGNDMYHGAGLSGGIKIFRDIGQSATISITNNIFAYVVPYAIYYDYDVHYTSISNNVFFVTNTSLYIPTKGYNWDNIFSNNVVKQCYSNCIYSVGLNLKVIGNTFEDIGYHDWDVSVGLNGDHNDSVGIYMEDLNGLISGNIFVKDNQKWTDGAWMSQIDSHAIFLNQSNYTNVKDNFIENAGQNGIKAIDSYGIGITGNIIINSSENGILINRSDSANVISNIIQNSYMNGIWLKDVNNSVISTNIIKNSDYTNQKLYDGIRVINGSRDIIMLNRVFDSSRYEFYCEFVNNTQYSHNTFYGTLHTEPYFCNETQPSYSFNNIPLDNIANSTYVITEEKKIQFVIDDVVTVKQIFGQGFNISYGDFFVDGTTFSVRAGTNRVGIGTDVPSDTLDVIGNIKCSAVSYADQLNSTKFMNTSKANFGNFCIFNNGTGLIISSVCT